jgi:adenosylcobyric acid synthase
LGLLDVDGDDAGKAADGGGRGARGDGRGFHGYEIHIGRTDGPDRARPFAHVAGVAEGARDASARVQGSYLHGMFRDDGFRAAWLAGFGVDAAGQSYGAEVEATLDALAAHMEAHLDVEGLLALAALGGDHALHLGQFLGHQLRLAARLDVQAQQAARCSTRAG